MGTARSGDQVPGCSHDGLEDTEWESLGFETVVIAGAATFSTGLRPRYAGGSLGNQAATSLALDETYVFAGQVDEERVNILQAADRYDDLRSSLEL